jgi:hypothetical protein
LNRRPNAGNDRVLVSGAQTSRNNSTDAAETDYGNGRSRLALRHRWLQRIYHRAVGMLCDLAFAFGQFL